MPSKSARRTKQKVVKSGAGPLPDAAPTPRMPWTEVTPGPVKPAKHLMKDHPIASAVTLLGAGVLAGVIADKVFHHEPTVGELLLKSLKKKTAQASTSVANAASASIQRAGSRARKALK